MKSLLAILLFATASLPASDLPQALHGYVGLIDGSSSLPSYFNYKPRGGVFFRGSTEKRRLEWMLSRQSGESAVLCARSFRKCAPDDLDGECAVRAVAVLAGVRKEHQSLGDFTLVFCRTSKTSEGHAFVIWRDKSGQEWALDSAEWQTVTPLAAYLKLRDVSDLRRVKCF